MGKGSFMRPKLNHLPLEQSECNPKTTQHFENTIHTQKHGAGSIMTLVRLRRMGKK